MVALVNQNIIPVRFTLPFWGEVVYLTKGYEFNLNLLLFWGSSSLLQNINIEELRVPHVRKQKIQELEKKIAYLALLNFILMPFIVIHHVLYSLYQNLVRVKNEPGSLAGRCWSQYGRLYLRHYNELEHELTARLNRAYKPAMAYLNSFSSPSMAIGGNATLFMASAVFAVTSIISLCDDDFYKVEHVINILAISAIIIAISGALVPDENLVWVPELLMDRIVAQIHYLPDSWAGKIHTGQVRNEFSRLFQYKFVHLLEELMSPIITPFILYFSLRHRSQKIIEFFQMFTVEVEGIGNVCSFAQMNIQQHGSPSWQPQTEVRNPPTAAPDGGRTELSLVHFAFTNPDWKPPEAGAAFLNALKHRTRDAPTLAPLPEHQFDHSINSLNLTAQERMNTVLKSGISGNYLQESNYPVRGFNGSVTRLEGPLYASGNYSMQRSYVDESIHQSCMSSSVHSGLPPLGDRDPIANMLLQPQTQTAFDMERSCIYLRNLNYQRRNYGLQTDPPPQQPSLSGNGGEDALGGPSSNMAGYEEASYYGGRIVRTPSPPAVDPFNDIAIMSSVSSLPDDVTTSRYQNLITGATDLIHQQQQQLQYQQQAHYQPHHQYQHDLDQQCQLLNPLPRLHDSPPPGSSSREESPLLPSNQR